MVQVAAFDPQVPSLGHAVDGFLAAKPLSANARRSYADTLARAGLCALDSLDSWSALVLAEHLRLPPLHRVRRSDQHTNNHPTALVTLPQRAAVGMLTITWRRCCGRMVYRPLKPGICPRWTLRWRVKHRRCS